MDLSTTFEDFASTVTTDKRSQALDAGNIKLTYRTVSGYLLGYHLFTLQSMSCQGHTYFDICGLVIDSILLAFANLSVI